MTKLDGTSGQIFVGIAETIHARTTARSGPAAGGQAQAAHGRVERREELVARGDLRAGKRIEQR